MNIEGLSATTLEKFIGHGWIHNFGDLYDLAQHHDEIVQTEGFGENPTCGCRLLLKRAVIVPWPNLLPVWASLW